MDIKGSLEELCRRKDIPEDAKNQLQTLIASFGKYQARSNFVAQRLQEDKKITERFLSKTVKELEEANRELKYILKEREKSNERLAAINRELEQFAYLTSHDLQEPLRSILNFAGLLREKKQDVLDLETQTYLEFIDLSAQRMSNLIRALLDYSRIGKSGSREWVMGEKLLDEVLDDLTAAINEKRASIRRDPMPRIYGVSTELHSLFQNLISNALKYAKPTEPPCIHVGCEEQGSHWMFFIRDNGIGFEDRFKDKIFIMFQRLRNARKEPGSGVGLAQCKKIVELHSGKIWVESAPSVGSTFYFTLAKN